MVLIALFYTAIRIDSVSPLRCPFLKHVQVFSCQMSIVYRLKNPYSWFSLYFFFLVIVFLLIIVLLVLFLVTAIRLSLIFIIIIDFKPYIITCKITDLVLIRSTLRKLSIFDLNTWNNKTVWIIGMENTWNHIMVCN